MHSTDRRINAAVLVPIYRDNNNRLRLVLIRRSPGGIYGGQLAFPGGKYDQSDKTMLCTALRESHEEIGLAPDRVQVLSELPAVDTQLTGFRIFPFLGAISPFEWLCDEREVAEVIDHDLLSLTDPDMYGEEVVQQHGWPAPRLISFYRIGDAKLWGASFRILHPLLPRIIGQEWVV